MNAKNKKCPSLLQQTKARPTRAIKHKMTLPQIKQNCNAIMASMMIATYAIVPVGAAAIGYCVIPGRTACVIPAREPVAVVETVETVETVPTDGDFELLQFDYIPAREDVAAIARTIWGEARGVADPAEQEAVGWCVLNRLDAGWADTVLGVVSAPGQFEGYDANHPVTDEFAAMARKILTAHWRESQGERDVGRVLPKEFLYFASRGDGRNYFRTEYRGGVFWEGV